MSSDAPAPRRKKRGHPFLVLTLQRTGGTNLTKNLKQLSSFPIARQHEPFNLPRVYGHVTREWKKSRDMASLQASMREICAKRQNIKHCVEMVPPKITQCLIEAAVENDYRYLFLYRRDIVGRILSTEYAQRTKVWGPNHVDKVAMDAKAFETPLEVETLAVREEKCVRLLNDAWRQLADAGQSPEALAYEDIYAGDAEDAVRALSRVLTYLGLSRGAAEDRALLDDLRARGDQQTRDRYARFGGIETLRERVASLPGFDFAGGAA